jgi:hypothetical protein
MQKTASLIQKNTELLASLEEEWSDLGAWRTIDFHAEFHSYIEYDENALSASELAESFVAAAREEDFQCDSWGKPSDIYYVKASKKLEATASEITIAQERLSQLAEENDGCLKGWSYPPKKEVMFWPGGSVPSFNSNTLATKSRADILFNAALVEDPFRINRIVPAQNKYFSLIPSEFLRLARDKPPKDPKPTVSAFSQWVYSLYSDAYGSDIDKERGKESEKEIWERRVRAINCNDNSFLRKENSPWNLIHNGLHLNTGRQHSFFEIPQLHIKGIPLRASPDLIYVNRKTSEALIVEVKHSHMAIPRNLWPNIWAQLWCYSQVDVVARTTNLTVVGEVWGDIWARDEKVVCLRASVRRNPRAPAYHRFFHSLFEIYRGPIS